jgi:hypothetical protein
VNTRPNEKSTLPRHYSRRSILCHTHESDIARESGIPWLRAIGDSTSSTCSLQTAKAWLENCIRTDIQDKYKSVCTDNVRSTRPDVHVPPVEFDHVWEVPEHARQDRLEKFAAEGPTRLLFITNPSDIEDSPRPAYRDTRSRVFIRHFQLLLGKIWQ